MSTGYWDLPRVSRAHDVLRVVVTGMPKWALLTPIAQDFLEHAWSTAASMHATPVTLLQHHLKSLASQLGYTEQDLHQVRGYMDQPMWWELFVEAARQPSWVHSHDWHATRIVHNAIVRRYGAKVMPPWAELNLDAQGFLVGCYTQCVKPERLTGGELLDSLNQLAPLLYDKHPEHLDQLRTGYLAEDGAYLWVDFAARAREIEDQYR